MDYFSLFALIEFHSALTHTATLTALHANPSFWEWKMVETETSNIVSLFFIEKPLFFIKLVNFMKYASKLQNLKIHQFLDWVFIKICPEVVSRIGQFLSVETCKYNYDN